VNYESLDPSYLVRNHTQGFFFLKKTAMSGQDAVTRIREVGFRSRIGRAPAPLGS